MNTLSLSSLTRKAFLALSVTFALSPLARADVRIVTEISVINSNAQNAEATPQTVTTLVKGRLLRRESADGTVLLIDADKKQVHILNPQQKSYYTLSLKDARERGSKLEGRMAQMLSLDVKINMKSQKGDESQRTIAGHRAEAFALDGSASLTFEGPRGGGFSGGGFPGGGQPGGGRPGGGFPGGGFPGGGAPPGGGRPGGGQGAPPEMPRFALTGDLWAADAAKTLGVESKDAKEMAFAFAHALLPENSPFLKTLCDRTAQRLPLAGRLTVQHPGAPPQQGQQPPNNTSGPPSTSQAQTVAIAFATKSIEMEVTLEDALFTIPADFTRTSAPPVTSAFGSGFQGRGGRP